MNSRHTHCIDCTICTDRVRTIVRDEIKIQARHLVDHLKEPAAVDARDAKRRALTAEARRAMERGLKGYATWDVLYLIDRLIQFVEPCDPYAQQMSSDLPERMAAAIKAEFAKLSKAVDAKAAEH